eukprot:747566-Hanusia_phi.AAC.4
MYEQEVAAKSEYTTVTVELRERAGQRVERRGQDKGLRGITRTKKTARNFQKDSILPLILDARPEAGEKPCSLIIFATATEVGGKEEGSAETSHRFVRRSRQGACRARGQ